MIDKLLKEIMTTGDSFKGKTIEQMTEDEKVKTLGFMIETAFKHSQQWHSPGSTLDQLERY